ncbi:response regulator [Microvirga antarctica]|uniref:response regulator n=1 Tax=Microvirga antarctica TaxID=2819233 RepID=UPI001B3003B3|nr:response regulator [Microvirga antarctica]
MTSSKSCILVVDADILVRHALAEYLRDCGYRVIEAVNADEAMAVLMEPTVTPHVVLADVTDPEIFDGFGLARWIRANRTGVEVILVGSIRKAAAEAAELCEEGPHLSKPYEPAVVVDRIKKLLAAAARAQ